MTGRRLYIIAGCNGAGKTTAARQSLLDDLQCSHWVSDDDIAYSLSPQAPEQVFARAARMMIERIGLGFIIALMCLAFGNDIVRFIFPLFS